ncbi:MAG: hypothetical protein K2W95_23585 [Candidatus Obscuribacterales bacterium]|nr:hypothetical protein [Candidatus Obscuribacterales bacterium]
MSLPIKIILAVLPFIIAVSVGVMYLQPALDEMSAKSTQVEEKSKEKEDFATKLNGEKKVQEKKVALESEINSLRAAVPKQPDLELLTVDLEKMCKDSGIDLVSIQPPKTDGSQSSFAEPESSTISKGKENLKSALNGATGGSGPGGKKKEPEVVKPDLEEISRQIEVTGDYDGLMRLVHKLETYERVIKITQMKEHIPKKETGKTVKLPESGDPADGDILGDPKQLYVSMKITAYYLP